MEIRDIEGNVLYRGGDISKGRMPAH